MRKKLIAIVAVVAAFGAWADTETVGGYTWTYRINDDMAEIATGNWGNPAISPSPTGAVTIPSTLGGKPVTCIGDYAFRGCSGLTSVTIPDSVTSIGDSAFIGCSGLTSAMIPDGVTSIGDDAFYGCSGLMSVTIGNSVTNIGDYAFRYCSDLLFDTTTIPGVKLVDDWVVGNTGSLSGDLDLTGIRGVGGAAFKFCDGLTSVTIPDGVTSIGDSAFEGCSGLTSVTIPNSVTRIGLYAFGSCFNLTRVHIQDIAAWCGIAFDGNPLGDAHAKELYLKGIKVTSLQIPNGVDVIGKTAFSGFAGLMDVTIPDSVTAIGENAFCACNSLTNVIIGSSVRNIGKEAFGYCGRLTAISIPSSVRVIDDSAFSSCGLTSVKIPEGVTNMGDSVFSDCRALSHVTIDEGVLNISASAFSGCGNLGSVMIPSSVMSIGRSAFYGCDHLCAVYITDIAKWCGISFADAYANPLNRSKSVSSFTSSWPCSLYLNERLVTSLAIPYGVKTVCDYAFSGCTYLEDVIIPNSVTNIGNFAFSDCGDIFNVTIPNSVTSIGDCAFRDCSGLTSVTIPASVTSIGNQAFYGCSGLTSVTIGNGVTRIGDYAFYGCSGLTRVTIPASVTSIGGGAFSGCSGLTSVAIGNGVTSIGSYAFYGCSELTSVYITDLAKWCGISFGSDNANPLCYANDLYLNGALVTDLTIPNGVTSIGSYAFYNCSGLTSVTIPDSVTSIGDYAFRDCSSLMNVTIGNSVTSIGYEAFSGCSGLTNLVFKGNAPAVGGSAFDGVPSKCVVHVNGMSTGWGVDDGGLWYGLRLAAVLTIKDGVLMSVNPNSDTSITIPSSVRNIGASALAGCSGVRILDIPTSVRQIGVGAFADGVKTVIFHGAPPEVVDEKGNVVNPDIYAGGGVFGPYGSIPSDVHVVYPPEFADAWGGEQRRWCGAWAGCGPDVSITPSGKTVFSGSVVVSIESSWTNAVIHYTADGVEPTEASPIYRKPITVNRPCTIKATAISTDCEWSHVVSAQFGYGRTANPRIYCSQGTTFYHRDNMVSFYSDTAGAEYVYTLDGSDPTKGGIEYTGPFSISTLTVVRVVAKTPDYVDSDVVEQTFTREWETVATPSIRTGELDSANVVTISCWTDDAEIWYSTGGGYQRYTGPFRIFGATTVRAYAVKDDWLQSETATKEIVKAWNDGGVVGQNGKIFVSTTSSIWREDKSVSYSGGSSLRSGVIGAGETSDLRFTVAGKGTVSFHWRTSCEDDPFMNNTDYVRFLVDGVEKGRLDGISGWEAFSAYIGTDGPHVFTWEYVKDGQDSDGEDCAWVDEVAFRPDVMAWIRFNGNDNTSGTLPDAISHYLGEKVTLPAQGTLARARYDFVGWSDGTKVYGPNSVYEAPDTDVTLLASWMPRLTAPPVIHAPERYAAISTDFTISAASGAAIYYTTDGSEPTEASARFWGLPVEITGTKTIKTIAVADNCFPSEVVTMAVECLWKSATVNGVTWYYTADGTLKKGVGLTGKAVLPDKLNGTAITKIGRALFWIKGRGYCSDPVALVVPEGVVEMENEALGYNPNLEKLVLPSTLRKIGDWCFSDCNCLAEVYWCMADPPAIDQGSEGGLYNGSNASLISHLPKGWGDLSTHRWNDRAFVEWTPPANGATGMIDEIIGKPVTKVTVTFDANGGYSDETERKVDSGTAIGALPSPSYLGYDFAGWFTAASGGTKVTEATKITAAVTYYAHWMPISYAIQYELEGGVNAAGNPNSYTIEQRIVLAAPTRAGYTFKGWTPDGGIIEQGSTGDRRFVAVWELNAGESAYTLTFDANGGEVDTSTRSVLKGAAYGELPVPTRKGYEFVGWFTAADSGEKATKHSIVDSDVKLYAHWTPVRYAISYVLDGGRNAVDNPEWYTIEMEIALTAPTRDGYRFLEWTPDGGRIAKGTISNLTFTAMWEKIAGEPVTVTFDANGGRTYEPTRAVARNAAVGSLPEPVRDGYVVVGWFTERNGGVKISESTVIEGAVTFYVHWKPENYNIVYVLNGGTNAAGNPAMYTVENEVTLLAPTRRGYTFAGWTPDGGKIAKGSTGDRTFTAAWTQSDDDTPQPMLYTVRFDSHGGTGRMENQTLVKDMAAVLYGCTFTRTGYTFAGWAVSTTGGVVYGDGEGVVNVYEKTGADVVLYAVWQEASTPVICEDPDGSAPAAAASVYDGYLYDKGSGAVVGTIQVKVGKPNANTGLAGVSATVTGPDGKNKKLKADGNGKKIIASDGPTTVVLAGGEPCEVTLGAEGLSGFYGAYAIDGSRNFFTSKDKSEANAANDVIAQWIGVVNVVWDGGVASVSIAKKGKVKASVTLANGTKATANSQLLVGDEWLCVPVVVAKKVNIAFTLWLPRDGGAVVVEGLPDGAVAGKAGALKSGAAFKFDAAALAAALGDATYAAQLPDGLSVEQAGKKWIVAGGAKAGKVQLAKGAASPADVDEAKAGANPSALKLTYKAKDGTFKGTFKAYTLVNGKPNVTTVNVSGILVGDKGYGTLSVKKPSVSAPVEIR